MKLISVPRMQLVKWAPFVVVGLIVALHWWFSNDRDPVTGIVIGGAAVFAVLYVQWKRRALNSADQVFDCGDRLIVRFRGDEELVAISNIDKVVIGGDIGSTIVELHLTTPSKFGSKITFHALRGKKALEPSPIAAELRDRVERRAGRVV